MVNDWTKVLGFPGYRVYKHEIDEQKKQMTLWIRRKRGNQVLRCPGCGRRVPEIHEVIELLNAWSRARLGAKVGTAFRDRRASRFVG